MELNVDYNIKGTKIKVIVILIIRSNQKTIKVENLNLNFVCFILNWENG